MPLFSRGPEKPKKPEPPKGPPKPKRKEPVIVRTYHAEGFGSEKKMAKLFEDEARRLARDGYVPSQTAAQNAKPASAGMGGFGMIKGGYLTVTYLLTPEARAAQEAALVAYEAYKRDEPRLMGEWRQAVAAWEEECRRIDEAYKAQKAATAAPGWVGPQAASTSPDAPSPTMWGNPIPPPVAPTPPGAPVTQSPPPAVSATNPVQAVQAATAATLSSPASETSPGDLVERLKALAELRSAGIVSDEEYEDKRKELLARL